MSSTTVSFLDWSQHLIVLPILLPLFCGLLLILINESRHQLKFVINLASVLGLLLTALILLGLSDRDHWPDAIGVYLAANWSAPFSIVLLVDRLASIMLVLTAIMALCALIYSMLRWSRIGVHFHSLFQFLLMGLNGAFLTHDLFNLFVFFEVMLAASYGLLLHGYNLQRIRAGMYFIAVNLVASMLILIGVALIYAMTGTLNMSDLALRIALLEGGQLLLLQTGVSILVIAFLVKSAMWPLGFWLPTVYAAASPPAAVMLALMTKVGIYVLIRLWLLLFTADAGAAAGFGLDALFWGGIITVVFGSAGMLASDVQGKIAGYAAILSSGTLLTALGYGDVALIAPMLFYLVSSTLAIAVFILLIELIDRSRNTIQDLLAVTMEAFDIEEAPEQPVGVSIPAQFAFLGLAFFLSALVISGLPPLSGFIAKFALFHTLFNNGTEIELNALVFVSVVILSGLAAIISLMRFGVRVFWASGVKTARLQVTEVFTVTLVLVLLVGTTLQAQPLLGYFERTSSGLHEATFYSERVLSAPVVQGGEAQ